MQHASCMVALGGDITFTVFKPDVTVAEIAILKAIHGADAVRDIEPTYSDRRSHAEERERLTLEYGVARDHKDEPVIAKLFPGLSPLPANFSDIGIEIPDPVEEKPSRRKSKAVEEESSPSE